MRFYHKPVAKNKDKGKITSQAQKSDNHEVSVPIKLLHTYAFLDCLKVLVGMIWHLNESVLFVDSKEVEVFQNEDLLCKFKLEE